MARKPKDVEHDGGYDCAQLETNLRMGEALWRQLTAIKVKGDVTVSTHDKTKEVPANSLVLVCGDDSAGKGPAGSTPICQGTALIKGVSTKVSAFRKAP